jgi:DNA-binding MarR family transcriptional regulator
MYCSNDTVPHIREASRSLIRELGLLSASLGGKELPASAIRALIEIGDSTSTTSLSLSKILNLESSNFGWILAKLVDTGAVIEISSAEDTRHKILSVTDKGKRILSKIDSLADERVMNALEELPETSSHEQVLHGIRSYAAALRAQRLEEEEDKTC